MAIQKFVDNTQQCFAFLEGSSYSYVDDTIYQININKMKGTPILKLAMVKRLKLKKNPPQNQKLSKICRKKSSKNSSKSKVRKNIP